MARPAKVSPCKIKTVLCFEIQQGDSALPNIHLSDPSEQHVDGNADEDDEKVWTPMVSRRLLWPRSVQSPYRRHTVLRLLGSLTDYWLITNGTKTIPATETESKIREPQSCTVKKKCVWRTQPELNNMCLFVRVSVWYLLHNRKGRKDVRLRCQPKDRYYCKGCVDRTRK